MVEVWSVPVFHLIMQLSEFRGLVQNAHCSGTNQATVVDSARLERPGPAMESSVRPPRTRFGAFEVDLRAGEVYKHGIRLKLQDQPFQILALLLERPGDVVTREELCQKLWPTDTFVDFDTGLNSAIKKLRDVLADSAEEPRYIETLPRRGYRFIAEVENGVPAAPLDAWVQSRKLPLEEEENGLRAKRPADGEVDVRPTGTSRARLWLVVGGVAGLALIAVTLRYAPGPHWAYDPNQNQVAGSPALEQPVGRLNSGIPG